MKREKIIELVWFAVVLTLFIFSIKLLRSGELQARVASFGMLAPLVLVALKMMTLVVAPLGGTPIYVLAGALFGNFNGFLISIIGDILGSSVCFFLSRRYGERILKSLAGSQNVDRILKAVGIIGTTKSFVKARLGFMSMPELLAYAAGLSRISFWTFTLINTLFYLPVDLTLVYLGSQIADISVRYFFIVPAIFFSLTVLGFFLLYRDYEKTEGM